MFYQSFTLYDVDGLRSGGYCAEWLVRTLLDAIMNEQGLHIELAPQDKAVDFPGPDEISYVPPTS